MPLEDPMRGVMRMAEPMHRIPPAGVTNGQSLRNVPRSCIQEVKDICLFYVQKCSGQYLNNKTAARYVHQMADEIILQLAGVASEIKKTRGEPELFQALLEEWNEHFPPSLGAIGTPKAIAALVASQSREISKLKSELETEKIQRENDVTGILRSMDAQLHSYRSGVIYDRKQQKSIYEGLLSERQDQARLQQKLHEDEIKQLKDQFERELLGIRRQFEGHLIAAEREKRVATKRGSLKLEKYRDKVGHKLEQLRTKYGILKENHQILKSKYLQLARNFNEHISLSDSEDTDEGEDEDEENEVDLEQQLEQELDQELEQELREEEEEEAAVVGVGKSDGEEEVKQSDHHDAVFAAAKTAMDAIRENKELREKRQQERELQRRQKLEAKKLQQQEREKKRASSVERTTRREEEVIRQLKERCTASTVAARKLEVQLSKAMQNQESTKHEIAKLVAETKRLLEERTVHLNRLAELEELYEGTRRALEAHTEQGTPAEREIKGKKEVLCHTPHFLGKADTTAPSKAVGPYMTPYFTAGHF